MHIARYHIYDLNHNDIFFALQGDPGMSNRHFYIENRLNVIAVNNLVERLIVWDYSF